MGIAADRRGHCRPDHGHADCQLKTVSHKFMLQRRAIMSKTRKFSGSSADDAGSSTTGLARSLTITTLAGYGTALCVVALVYSLVTGHIWEDALITLRSAENFVNGQGLTYHVGTRVHTFTSPINVLMLALAYLLTGKGSYIATLWVYRLFAIAAFAGSGALLLQAAARAVPRWSFAVGWLAIVYLFDAKAVVFSSNGMETAYMLLFLAWAIYLLSPPRPDRWLARGLCWAGLMWARPDGAVYIAALAGAELLFGGLPRRLVLRSIVKSAAICAAVYSPWFLWAWSYYGSPVPNTIVAKSNPLGAISQFWNMMNAFPDCVMAKAARVFRQVYSEFGFVVENIASQRLSDGVTKSLGMLCLIYWLLPLNDRLGRMTSFAFAMVCLYFGFQEFTSPWYIPPAALLGLTTIARAAATLANIELQNSWLTSQSRRKAILAAVLCVLAAGQIALFVLTTWEMKIQQAEIESGTRMQIGLWLKEHGKPDDTVFLEPLGYIGYFSGMTMHDFPGLASPDVVKLRREKKLPFLGLIQEINPDWVILRSHEFEGIASSGTAQPFLERYELVKIFNAVPRLETYAFLPGKAYMKADIAFGVFQRKPTP
jgi:hypothetical protein